MFLFACLAALGACRQYVPAALDPPDEVTALVDRTRSLGDLTAPPLEVQESWLPVAASVDLSDGIGLSEAALIGLTHAPPLLRLRQDARIAGAEVLRAGLLSNPEVATGLRLDLEDGAPIIPLDLSVRLPLGDRREAERAVARAGLDERRAMVAAAEVEMLIELRSLWTELSRDDSEQRFRTRLVADFEPVLERYSALHAAGEIDAATLLIARADLDEQLLARARSAARFVKTVRSIHELIGLVPDAPITLDVTDAPAVPEPAAANQENLLRLPELEVARLAFATSEAAVRLAHENQWPDLTIGISFEHDRDENSLGPFGGLNWPLFDDGGAAIGVMQARRDEARIIYRNRVLDALHAEQEARADLASSEAALAILEAGALSLAEEALEAVAARLRSGRGDLAEALATRRTVAEMHLERLALQAEIDRGRLRTAATGGLFLAPVPHEPIGKEIP